MNYRLSWGELAPVPTILRNMVLNLTVGLCVWNFIFFFYKEKPRWNSDLQNFFGEKLKFGLFFTVNRQLGQNRQLCRHCDVIHGMLVLFWNVWKEETHYSYTMVPNKHTSGVYFSSSQGKIAWLSQTWNEPAGFELKHFRCILYSRSRLSTRWQLYVLCLRMFLLSSDIHFHSVISIYGSIWLNFGMVPIHPSLSWILFSLIKQKLKYLKS